VIQSAFPYMQLQSALVILSSELEANASKCMKTVSHREHREIVISSVTSVFSVA